MPGNGIHRTKMPIVALQVIVAIGTIIWFAISTDSLTAGMEVGAFFLGGAGVMLMFYRWRRHGDHVAQALCLATFGTWAVSAALASGSDAGVTSANPGYWIAGLALLIGFGGGLTTLLRMYLSGRKRSAPPPGSPS